MKKFPIKDDPETLGQMFAEIGYVVEEHLGFFPHAFVIILTDGRDAQTLFAGDDRVDFTKLLTEAAENHQRKV